MSEKTLPETDKNYTVEQYAEMERRGAGKHEFAGGRILPTASSSRTHNLIGSNTTIAVGSRVRGQKCEVYVNDMRVQLTPTYFCYPDVIVVNGEPSFSGRDFDVLLNPTLVVEIFSRNTIFQDKTEKLEKYLAMPSIKECLLVKEDEMRVEHYAKQNLKQWIYRIYNDHEDVISLDSINCKISLAEVYGQIRFGQTGTRTQAVN